MKNRYDWRDLLSKLIKERGMNARSFSLSLGFSESYISNCILKRRGESISENNFNKIAQGLNVHPATLRYGVDLSIDIGLYNACRKAVLKAAKTRGQSLTEAQKRLMTIRLYNNSILEKTVSFIDLNTILDKKD